MFQDEKLAEDGSRPKMAASACCCLKTPTVSAKARGTVRMSEGDLAVQRGLNL